MPAVVRPHRQLVDDQLVPDGEQLHRQQPGDAKFRRDGEPELLRPHGDAGSQVRRRRDDLAADPVFLDGLHDRVRRALPLGRPGHQHRELAVERHVLLDEQADSVGDHIGG